MVSKLKEEIVKLNDSNKIDDNFTNLNRIFNYRKPYDPNGKCHINRMGLLAVITPEGDVYPNIAEIGNEEFCVGNILHSNFENIWNSLEHTKVKDVSDKYWQDNKCKNCRAISYNLRINDMVSCLPCEEDSFL